MTIAGLPHRDYANDDEKLQDFKLCLRNETRINQIANKYLLKEVKATDTLEHMVKKSSKYSFGGARRFVRSAIAPITTTEEKPDFNNLKESVKSQIRKEIAKLELAKAQKELPAAQGTEHEILTNQIKIYQNNIAIESTNNSDEKIRLKMENANLNQAVELLNEKLKDDEVEYM